MCACPPESLLLDIDTLVCIGPTWGCVCVCLCVCVCVCGVCVCVCLCVCICVCDILPCQPIDNVPCYMLGHFIHPPLLIQQIIVHYGNEEMRNPVQLSLYERFHCETVPPFVNTLIYTFVWLLIKVVIDIFKRHTY